ncbi:glycosyltransferase involved in cell wall biosynthesis [Paenibacillus taihuensis]|uniref:Glycosyltransferase involved in cell wall biosynthesis n=1 Tax=Paenibacillus taihuensis TaxID=1156355 RepID=A0A3D9SE41_9BACL|nr:glycosyltransferase [Paenibacillus taihuensis]REE93148.1 glycosyltransferase involved in cell wall biosynthesis [Paenibacillus taihuensis]
MNVQLMGTGESRLKVMLFSHLCGDGFITGAEKYLSLLVRELSFHADCTLVVPQEGLLKGEAEANGILTLIEPFPVLWNLYRPDGELASTEANILAESRHAGLIQLLQLRRPDIVIVNSCVNALPAMAAKELGIPVVWIIQEIIYPHETALQSAHFINRYSDLIVGISHHSLALFRGIALDGKQMLLPPTAPVSERGWEQHYPANEDLSRGLPAHRYLIGYISAGMQWEKGLDHFLLMSLSLCAQRQDLCFLCIASPLGNVDYESYCMSLVQQSEFRDRFRFVRFQKNIESVYSLVDMVVVPSLVDEGFGMIALEALLFGKVTVAYRSGGLQEVLSAAGQENMLVEKGDISGLCSKVGEGLQETAGVDVERVRQVFGIESYRDRLASFFRELGPLATMARLQRNAAHVRPLRPNRLYRGNKTPLVYFIQRGTKRPIVSPKAFQLCGFRWSAVHVVSEQRLFLYPSGLEIHHDHPSSFPFRKKRRGRRKRGKRRTAARIVKSLRRAADRR